MNATTDSGLTSRETFPPLGGSRWTKERATVREICVTRSRAAFLAARLVKLQDDRANASTDNAMLATDTEETRKLLRQVIQQYARLLVQLGEPRDVVVRLVDELPLESESRTRSGSASVTEMRRDLIGWAAQAVTAD